MLPQPLHDLHLLLQAQPVDRDLNDPTHTRPIHSNKALIIHERKESHDKLTIHTVRHAAVTRDAVAEILDFESALEATGKEAAKGSDERGKGRKG